MNAKVTSPTVAWAVVRHSFVIRVSCFVTTSAVQVDVVDININNILSFGFGANAGVGPSCLKARNLEKAFFKASYIDSSTGSDFVDTVRWVGWSVLIADLIFLFFSIYFLFKLFNPPDRSASKFFMISCGVAIIFSFIYGMMFVGACVSVGGAFPVFEFIFSLVDLILWNYFLLVIYSYRREQEPTGQPIQPTQSRRSNLK